MKIRNAELQKIPYILIVGDKEIQNNSVCVRERGRGDLGAIYPVKFVKQLFNGVKLTKFLEKIKM